MLLGRFDGAGSADVEANARIELERIAAGRRLRIPEYDADLLTKLIDEDQGRTRLVDLRRELAQRLAHEPRLQTHVRIAHIAVDFRLRHEGRDGVDDDHVDRPGANEQIDDFERLLAGVGLRHEETLGIDTDRLGVRRVECMFGVDERRDASEALRLPHCVQGQRGLSTRFGPEDLDDTAARISADAERLIEQQRPRRNDAEALAPVVVTHTHNRAFAECLLDGLNHGLHGPKLFRNAHRWFLSLCGACPARDGHWRGACRGRFRVFPRPVGARARRPVAARRRPPADLTP
ncbi:MAG: hypothetical protein HOW73_17105 [Polyangiaceae bacterium]|nr:hypothetical protein [Polyangiaceae bacterium]